MTTVENLFTAALGLHQPWHVDEVKFSLDEGEIHFNVACGEKRLPCPVCGAGDQPVHDRLDRTWQHLHFFQYRAFIHAKVPRIACTCGKTTQMEVPWARAGSGFTLLMEALAVMLCKTMAVAQVARLLSVNEQRLWRMITSLVQSARDQESYTEVKHIGVDEKHVGRLGFVTLFHDADERRVIFDMKGRDAKVFEAFVKDIQAHEGDPSQIEVVSMDLSRAYQAGATKHLPQAVQCFDRFHLVKLVNEAVDQVRRAEVKTEPSLKGLRWGLLKDPGKWNQAQGADMYDLNRNRLKTGRAWRMKEAFRDIVEFSNHTPERTRYLITHWISWARRSRLEPFKRLGATFKKHLEGIVSGFTCGVTNATAESINATVQGAIVRAHGFRTYRNLMAIVYLTVGKLTHLPAPPFQHRQTVQFS